MRGDRGDWIGLFLEELLYKYLAWDYGCGLFSWICLTSLLHLLHTLQSWISSMGIQTPIIPALKGNCPNHRFREGG